MLNFVSGPSKSTSQTDIDNDWTTVVDNLIPIKLNRFEINNGQIHYRDFYSSPKVDMEATSVEIIAENLSNVKQVKNSLPSTVTASARVYAEKNTRHSPRYREQHYLSSFLNSFNGIRKTQILIGPFRKKLNNLTTVKVCDATKEQ